MIRTKQMVFTVVILMTASTLIAADWPNWRGPDYDGVSKETDWDPTALNNLKIAWEAEIGTGFSAVSVADGRAYTIGNINKDTDVIYCFDAATGKKQWTYEYPEPLTPNLYEGGCNATPTILDGKVYTLSKTGKAFCLDAKTGAEIWKQKFSFKKPEWGFAGSPVIIDDLVIYNAGDAGIALKIADGSVAWKSGDETTGYASPVPFKWNNKQYVIMVCKEDIKLIEAKNGHVAMSYKWKTSYDINAADPVTSGDEFVITSGYGHGAALLKVTDNGIKEVWQNKSMRSQMSGPVLVSGYLYGMDDKKLACVEWATGEQKWTEKAPKQGAVCAAGDKIIVLGEKGDLSIIEASPEGYKVLSTAQVLSDKCWTMPIFANGHIYARNAVKRGMDKLVCVDVRKPAAAGVKKDD